MELPKQKLKPTRLSPKILLLYGLPKVGKTEVLTTLKNCLILDLEGGAKMYECLRVPIKNASEVDECIKMLKSELNKTGKPPYEYLAVDTVDKLEDFCIVSATRKYKASVIGQNFTGSSVVDLPKGLGYYYIREEVVSKLNQLSTLCKHLILVTHVKDKILDKGDTEVSVRDISLTGKLAGIVSSACDAVGYMYRDGELGSKLMVSFITEATAVMGSRFAYLAGKEFEFDWDTIFPPGALSEETAEIEALSEGT